MIRVTCQKPFFRRSWPAILLVSFTTVCLSACYKSMEIDIQNKPPLVAGIADTLMAGVAKVDITPPPGLPMAGFSMLSDYGAGFRTRLFARIIYLKPPEGPPVALVQCDLLAGSLVLHHHVAEQIADRTDVSVEGLLLAGTHTHSAPGNYFGSLFFNRFASNASGFDPAYFAFLSRRISEGIVDAYQTRRPARVAAGFTEMHGVARNRSLTPYRANKQFEDRPGPGPTEAVNPDMHMIRVDCLDDDGEYKPAGAVSLFSIHPNTRPDKLEKLYNGDVFAFIERELEWGVKRKYTTPWVPVHAALNHTHGDNNPDYSADRPENFQAVRRIGTAIGMQALALFESLGDELKDHAVVAFSSREIDLLETREINGVKICDRPVVGCPALAGARDRSSPLFYVPPFAPGWPRKVFTGGCQGHKRTALGPLQYLYLSPEDFPHKLFVQTIRIGDVLLMALPYEICFEAGRRMTDHVRAEAGRAGLDGIRQFALIGCANGFFGYVNTPEEYALQYYEGGQNFYGPQTGAFLQNALGELLPGLKDPELAFSLPPGWAFEMKTKSFYPKKRNPEGVREIHEPPRYVGARKHGEAYWRFRWIDVPPDRIAFHEPLIHIESRQDDAWRPLVREGIPVDDSGYDIAVICVKKKTRGNMGLYEARWYNPSRRPGEQYRFSVRTRGGLPVLYSDSFGE